MLKLTFNVFFKDFFLNNDKTVVNCHIPADSNFRLWKYTVNHGWYLHCLMTVNYKMHSNQVCFLDMAFIIQGTLYVLK